MKQALKTVLLFGSFDGLHPGHTYLIKEAQKYGDIIIVVAPNAVIKNIKGREPIHDISTRIKSLQKCAPKALILAGDNTQNTWTAIKNHKPDIIILGYDQIDLKTALSEIQDAYHFEIITLEAFHPEKYKSSLLRKK